MSECPHTDNADKCTCEPGCGCPGYELPMTAREKVAELEAEVEHARAIAACSIGQPDRAENVAYREEMEAKLRSARAEAEKSTVRDKVARAINPNDPDIVIRTGIADAAIAAHLDALKTDGYVIAPARLIEDLTDPDPCQWDHNHSCQAHGHFYIDQGELCPVEEAKRLIAAAEAQR